MKQLYCPKGKYTKIISNFGRGFPQTFDVSIASKNGEEISGEFIEKKYFWIFPENPINGELKAEMQFHRRWIDGIYSVAIKPNIDVVVTRK